MSEIGILYGSKVYLVIEEVEQVFDGERQCRTPVRRTEDRLEEIVDKFLKCAFRGQQPG